jgi:hypothetical protein
METIDHYLDGLRRVHNLHQYGWAVDVLSQEVYEKARYLECFPGKYGFAVLHTDELVGVWSSGGNRLPTIIRSAADKGGAKTVSCYDTGLVRMYERAGCTVVSRVPFLPSAAFEGWTESLHGKPDVVTLALPAPSYME